MPEARARLRGWRQRGCRRPLRTGRSRSRWPKPWWRWRPTRATFLAWPGHLQQDFTAELRSHPPARPTAACPRRTPVLGTVPGVQARNRADHPFRRRTDGIPPTQESPSRSAAVRAAGWATSAVVRVPGRDGLLTLVTG